ncbi:Phage tail tube protein, GTA-gp10 [Kaistia soli DSM 19436]|uniref:Phage tail tube protein, GTA-gp10 n=1 Tax=Kaistia soli DSM 19436 TaxID=1122133 RepID=A0A1M5PQW0_9HYPH|nr:gene transfer agent family protein [Kaistia soli]SHH04091.1 Phage tail tube protein, GTA-gp10 [Kaistia soli DSM 19436]
MTLSHREFLGDAEHDFCLTPANVAELERLTGAGIGTLFSRVIARAFYLSDLAEIIRLALIGGGMSPERALHLVGVYVTGRPLNETYPLALAILERLWFGADDQADAEPHEVAA